MSRRWAVALIASASLVASAPAASVASSQGPTAYAACTKAKIGGQRKCIARGQYCTRAYQRDYKRYGLSCTKRDARGRYHLR